MKRISIIFMVLILSLSNLYSQESLPPYHWAWNYLFYLKSAGYLDELDLTNRPWYRDQIARALLDVREENLRDNWQAKKLIEALKSEFQYEIIQLEEKGGSLEEVVDKISDEKLIRIKAGMFGEALVSNEFEDFDEKFDFNLHPQAGLKFGSNFYLYGNIKVFKEADADYIGKKFRDLHAYVEQGYFIYQSKWVDFKFGRDFLQVGPGRSGQLLFSGNSRPFDMYQVVIGKSFINFSFWGIQLDKRNISDSLQASYAPWSNRYLNAHRLSFNIRNKYYFGISEAVIYGGPNATWELGFMNPFAIYHGYHINGPRNTANSFYSVDWDLYFPHLLNLYGEFLIDDFQVDKKVPADLEPNELGLLLGFNWTDLLQFTGSMLNLEYIQLRNRTYNAPENDWEKFLHRNKVIGYYLGNDFKLITGNIEKWWWGDLNTKIFGSVMRKGEGTVRGEFNTDFLDYTVEEGYDEPFPWGIVERHIQIGLGIFYRPHKLGNLSINLAYNDFDNYKNMEGEKRSEFSFRVSLWLQWNRWWEVER
jgi:hypothetical protein